MLEFIVLGNVPGTQFNITFSWVLAVTAVFLIVMEIRYHKHYALKVQQAAVDADKLPAKRSPKRNKKIAAKSTTKTNKTRAARKKPTTRAKA